MKFCNCRRILDIYSQGLLSSNDVTATRTSKLQKKKQYVKTTTLHVHQTFLCDYVVKMPNFKFYEERKRATAKFYFFF